MSRTDEGREKTVGQIHQVQWSPTAGTTRRPVAAQGVVAAQGLGTSCTYCGASVTGGSEAVTAVLRGVGYDYCGGTCRDRHAEAVLVQSECCALCDLDAVGDTGRCAEHLDEGLSPGRYPLAS